MYFLFFIFYFGGFVNIDFIHVNVVNSTCWLRLIKLKKKILYEKKRITNAWLHFISPCYISCLFNKICPLLFGFFSFSFSFSFRYVFFVHLMDSYVLSTFQFKIWKLKWFVNLMWFCLFVYLRVLTFPL